MVLASAVASSRSTDGWATAAHTTSKLAGVRVQVAEPVGDQRAQVGRHRKRLAGRRLPAKPLQGATDLQARHRVAAGRVVQPGQGRPGHGEVQPGVQQLAHDADTDRADDDSAARKAEVGVACIVVIRGEPIGGDQPDRFVAEATKREAQCGA